MISFMPSLLLTSQEVASLAIVLEAEWDTEPVWKLSTRDKPLDCAGNRTKFPCTFTPQFNYYSEYAIPATLLINPLKTKRICFI
jgi:hypothetical protein